MFIVHFTTPNVLNGLTDHRRFLPFCLFFNLHRHNVCCCNEVLTLSCPLRDVVLNTHANMKDSWKNVSSYVHNIRNLDGYISEL